MEPKSTISRGNPRRCRMRPLARQHWPIRLGPRLRAYDEPCEGEASGCDAAAETAMISVLAFLTGALCPWGRKPRAAAPRPEVEAQPDHARARVSLAAIVVGFACATGVAHADGGPGAVYNDYAQDGVLSCNHSRADLGALLRSGSLNQYGDPLTLARLKLAVRKQLAGGCRKGSGKHGQASASGGTPGGGATTGGGGNQSRSKNSRGQRRNDGSSLGSVPGGATSPASASGDSASFFAGRAAILGFVICRTGSWRMAHEARSDRASLSVVGRPAHAAW